MRGARLMASWVLALFLMVMFLLIADQTLFPPTAGKNVIFPMLAQKSGLYLWEPTGRFVVGLLDVLAALLLLIPFTRRIGAILALLISAGAVAAYLIWFKDTAIPVEFGSTETDGGMLFDLTLALLGASVLLAIVHPGRLKAKPAADGGFYARAH